MAAKSKDVSKSAPSWLDKGTSNHMVGQQHAGKQQPVSTNPDPAAGRADAGGGYGKGGPETGGGHMSTKNHAGPQVPGQATAGGAKNGAGGFGNGKGIEGGTTPMFGKQQARPAQPK